MTKAKPFLGIAAAFVIALLAGWFLGMLGRSDMAGALEASEFRADVLAARAAVLDARVAIYNVNFGEASGHLEGARGMLGRADKRLKGLDRNGEASRVQAALTSIDEAQRMAGKLDQGANARAGEAAKALADVLDAQANKR